MSLPVWNDYREALAKHAPSAFANLAGPASPADLANLEAAIGQGLPTSLRELLSENDGQRSHEACCALPGLELLSSQRILQEWSVWAKLRASQTEDELETLDDNCRSLDDGVLDVYTHPGWKSCAPAALSSYPRKRGPMAQTYPELDELNEAFLRMLRADPQPLSSAALLWHELLQVYPETSAVRVRSRGDACVLLQRWVHPGPQLRVDMGRQTPLVWSEPEGEVKQAWDELVGYLKSCGMRHLHSAELRLDKPKARLRRGQNVKLRYSV